MPLRTIAREWGLIGCIGFGGPPAHISLLRKLCVTRRGWLSAEEFEDGVAAANLLPGPASTQLAIFCAWRLAGPLGAVVGGACFILPGLAGILALAALFLAARPPHWVVGASAGAGAAVPAVAAVAAVNLMPASWRRAGPAAQSPAAESAAVESAAAESAAAESPAAQSPGNPSPAAPGPAAQSPGNPSPAAPGPAAQSPGIPGPVTPGPAAPSPARAGIGRRRSGRLRPTWLRLGWLRLGWPHGRWTAYLLVGGVVGARAGQFLVLVLIACGLIELSVRLPGARPSGPASGDSTQHGRGTEPGGRAEPGTARPGPPALMLPLVLTGSAAAGGLLALAWVAFKVGALSYGGGFVIIPLMQHDAVHTYHWMTGTQFLTAVALGQVTPGPVVQTVAVVGFAAAGVGGGLLAALVAFTPSLAFVLAGGPRFAMLRQNAGVQAFLTGAGPAAIGAIAGSTVPLALALAHLWQAAVLGLAAVWLLALRRNVVAAIVGAAGLGIVAVLAGASLG